MAGARGVLLTNATSLKSRCRIPLKGAENEMLRNLTAHAMLLMLVTCTYSIAAQQAQLLESEDTQFESPVSYLSEPAVGSVLVLNANNGFFTKGAFKAGGKKQVAECDKELIKAHFSHLSTSDKKAGNARWHFWVTQPGEVKANVTMRVPKQEAGVSWNVSVDGETKVVTSQPSSESQPQAWELSFQIGATGKHTLQLEKNDKRDTAGTQLYQIQLTGSAIEGSSLLRARWRPKAIHSQFTSSTCESPQLWVFESQSVADFSSYSPMTTPFGYFGGSFTANQTAAGSLNFSMWAARSKQTSVPPLTSMPHLLATGNPQAEFSGFGHEGSGVKIRNWTPLDHQPKSLIQALRLQTSEQYSTYFGYLFDDRKDRWVLYAIGRKPIEKNKRRKKSDATKPSLRTASFCEVPGPPQSERTGDRRRIVRRRGWFMDAKKQWHPVDRQTSSTKSGPANMFIDAKDGWFLMGTGGMEFIQGKGEVNLDMSSAEKPSYLSAKKIKQLFEQPVVFGNHTVKATADQSTMIEYEFSKVDPKAKATLHYGTRDCLTFVARRLHGTEKKGLSAELLSEDRTWESTTETARIRDHKIKFDLKNLKPNTKYYFRVFVTGETGKSWDFETGSFETESE